MQYNHHKLCKYILNNYREFRRELLEYVNSNEFEQTLNKIVSNQFMAGESISVQFGAEICVDAFADGLANKWLEDKIT